MQAPVEAMLDVASHCEHTICSMSFDFWGRLASHLDHDTRPMAPRGAPPYSEEDSMAEQRRRVAFFSPAFERLVALIQGRVR